MKAEVTALAPAQWLAKLHSIESELATNKVAARWAAPRSRREPAPELSRTVRI